MLSKVGAVAVSGVCSGQDSVSLTLPIAEIRPSRGMHVCLGDWCSYRPIRQGGWFKTADLRFTAATARPEFSIYLESSV